MFILRECAACLFVAMFAAALFVAGGGTFLAVKAGCRAVTMRLRSLKGVRPSEARVAGAAVVSAILLLLILFAAARIYAAHAPQSAKDGGFTIKVNVNQVVLHATVRDRKGTPVSGLAKDAFRIYEDGAPQDINFFSHDDVPVEVGLIVDNSGSMRPKRAAVIEAALAFARSSNPQDQMFVVNFNERVSFGLPADLLFTDSVTQLESALSRSKPDGETALYDAVAAGLDHLKKGNRDKKVLIVISDGDDNASKYKKSEILTMSGQSDAIIYAIGLFEEGDPDQHFGVLKQLAKAAGGEAFLPESVKDVVPVCERIAHDIRSQYTLAYVPANHKVDGTYRTVQVKATASGRGRVLVRTRTGYLAPSPDSQSGKP